MQFFFLLPSSNSHSFYTKPENNNITEKKERKSLLNFAQSVLSRVTFVLTVDIGRRLLLFGAPYISMSMFFTLHSNRSPHINFRFNLINCCLTCEAAPQLLHSLRTYIFFIFSFFSFFQRCFYDKKLCFFQFAPFLFSLQHQKDLDNVQCA